MQKVYINNNGPIKTFEMEVEKFNLLIGEQATGKSTIAKSIYYLRTIKTKIIDYLNQIYDTNTYNNQPQEDIWFDRAIKPDLKDTFVKLFGYSWDLNPAFYLKYEYSSDIWIETILEKGRDCKQYISVTYSKKLFDSLRELQQEVKEIFYYNKGVVQGSLALANEERKRSHEMISHRVDGIFGDNRETYYIPAGRSLLTVMSNNRAVMSKIGNLDLITDVFMTLIDTVRNSFMQGVRKAHLYYPVEKRRFEVGKIADFIIEMEKGEYFYNGEREFLKIKETPGHSVAINFASSGQQEILWLLNFMYVLLLREEDSFVIIEEPEAHIYPLLQKKVMEFIVMFANIKDSGVFITTHSPYVLTVANNMYYAGVLSEEGQKRAVSKIVGKYNIIKKGNLSAYKLLNGGNLQDRERYIRLLDEEERELRSDLIDDVSAQVNEIYTALYDVELDREQR